METNFFTSIEFYIAMAFVGLFIVLDIFIPQRHSVWLRPFAIVVMGAAFARSAGWV